MVKVGRAAGAKFLVNSDAHDAGDLLNGELARKVALGAGLEERELEEVLLANPRGLLARLAWSRRRGGQSTSQVQPDASGGDRPDCGS